MDRISTVNLHNVAINSALNVQSQLAQVQIQESSTLVAQDFGTLGGTNTTQMLSLENNISQAQNWASQAQTVGARTQAMYTVIGSMATTVNSLQTQISQAMSSPNNATLLNTVTSLQKTLVSQLDSQYGNSYLFSGSDIGQQPVNLSNYPTVTTSGAYDPTTADTGYYAGDNNVQSVRVSSQQTLSYGVLGSNPAFEQAMRSIEAVIQAASVTSTSSLSGITSPTASAAAAGGPFTLTINGTAVTVNGGDSLSTVANNINTALSASGVTASLVKDTSGDYHLQLSGSSAITVTDTGSGLGLASASPLTSTQLNSALQQALSVANQAETSLSNLQSSVAAVSKQLNDSQTQQSTYVTFLQNSLSSVKDVDTAQVAAQMSQYQTQLQASYMAVASISKINLVQYL